MDFDLEPKNYRELKRMIKKAKKEYSEDLTEKIGEMCNLQGYIEAYYDLGLVTIEEFDELDEII